MKVRNIIPCSKIAEYVERILVIENNRVVTPFILPLYANAVPTLLFISRKGKLGNDTSNYLTLFGQTVFPETLTLTEEFTLIAYFFKPYSLINLFGVAARELTNKPIDLNLLAPKKTIELQEQLLNSGSTDDTIMLLDHYISGLINNADTECRLIKYAATKITHKPLKESLVSIQKELHITERTFQRLFEKNIGVAPGLYRRICQFNSGFIQLNKKKFHKLSDIAFQNGYADQSHYIRAFKEFTNITPKEYLRFGEEH